MELLKKYSEISRLETSEEVSAEHIIESDITFPDYYPDIVKVVKSTINTSLLNTSLSNGRVTVEGNAVIYVLYISTDAKLHSFEQRLPFSKSVDLKSNDAEVCTANAEAQFVNCLVLSPRRINLHSVLNIKIESGVIKADKVFDSADDEGIFLKKQEAEALIPKDYRISLFKINDSLETAGTLPTVSQIISYDTVVLLESTKVISGKILVKGLLRLKVLYTSEGEGTLQRFEGEVPFSQILEADISEEDVPFVKLSLAGTELFAKTDHAGALRLFEISANVKAHLYSFQKKEFNIVSDIYSSEYELKISSDKISFNSPGNETRESFSQRNTVSFGDIKIKEVIDVHTVSMTSDKKFTDSQAVFFGTLKLGFLLNTEDEGIIYEESAVDFSFKKSIDNSDGASDCIYSLTLTGTGFTIASENSVDLRSEYELNALIQSKTTLTAITDIEYDGKRENAGNAFITVYYADKGEKLWDIAKRFKTDAQLIKDENSLTAETLEEDMRLIITN